MSATRRARRVIAAVVAAIVLAAGGISPPHAAYAAPPLPAKMAAIGDSITQAIMTCTSLSLHSEQLVGRHQRRRRLARLAAPGLGAP